MGFKIKLEAFLTIAQRHGMKDTRWEPELFPGLIFKMVKPKMVLLIFATGKIVLTGAKSREQIYEAYMGIRNTLWMCRKEPL